MPADPVGVVREICAKRQRHFIDNYLSTKVQQTPGVLARADAPGLKRPLAVIIAVTHAVNDVARCKAALAARFHVGRTVREEVGIAAQIGRIACQIAAGGDFRLCHGAL